MPLSVLLLDDNRHFLSIFDCFHVNHGGDAEQIIDSVVTGHAPVIQAERLRPEILLVDRTLANVPGLRFRPQFRQTFLDAILIALSLRVPTESRDHALAASADAFISKTSLECNAIRRSGDSPHSTTSPEG